MYFVTMQVETFIESCCSEENVLVVLAVQYIETLGGLCGDHVREQHCVSHIFSYALTAPRGGEVLHKWLDKCDVPPSIICSLEGEPQVSFLFLCSW